MDDAAWGVDDAALRGGLPDELFVVVDDALEVVSAVVELPQLLVDGSLVVENIDDELFVYVLG
jgi:hypothetical protein